MQDSIYNSIFSSFDLRIDSCTNTAEMVSEMSNDKIGCIVKPNGTSSPKAVKVLIRCVAYL